MLEQTNETYNPKWVRVGDGILSTLSGYALFNNFSEPYNTLIKIVGLPTLAFFSLEHATSAIKNKHHYLTHKLMEIYKNRIR